MRGDENQPPAMFRYGNLDRRVPSDHPLRAIRDMADQAWASRNSFVPKDPATVVGTGAGGKKCLRDTPESKTDPAARLYKKSTAGEAKPSYLGHVIIENRNGLVVAACATQSSTAAGRGAAL